MIPTPILDAILIAVASVWAVLGTAILAGRYAYERRAQRAARMEAALRQGTIETEGALTPAEFQDMAFAGLPRAIELAAAERLVARTGEPRLLAVAQGRADAPTAARIAALQVIVSAKHPHAFQALDGTLRSGVRDLATAAVRMLIRLDDRRSAEILVAALCDGVHTPSRLAAAIDRLSVPRSDILAPLLDHEETAPRFWGVRLAGRLNAAEWAPRVRALTSDPDPLVRRAAVEAIGAIGEPKDVVLLLTRFLDPAPIVRLHAARASAAFPSPALADALAELLRDREWVVRAAARDALERLGAASTEALVRTLWHEDRFAANSAAEVILRMGTALAWAQRVHANPHDRDHVRLLARFLSMSSPHLEQALASQLGPDATALVFAVARAEAAFGEARTS